MTVTDHEDLAPMAALPQTGDTLLVVRESQAIPSTERLPWELLFDAWVPKAGELPTAVAAEGAYLAQWADESFLYVRGPSQWRRMPFTSGDWADSYNRIPALVLPSLAANPDPIGPNGHIFYDTTEHLLKVNQNGSYTSFLSGLLAYRQFTDGVSTATSNSGLFKFRSSDGSVTVTVTNNDLTHGDNVNLVVDPGEISTGDLNDDGTFALVGHNHAGVYAPLAHDHDGDYLTDISGQLLSSLSDVTITSITAGELLAWSGTEWINRTLAEAGIAAASHEHAASAVTSGSFDDLRIAQTNVTQHQAAINHNALLNYVANRHVDHSAVSILTASGSGIQGGGDLTTNRSLALDFSNLTESVVVDLAEDFLVIWDTSAGGHRKVHPSYFGFDAADHTHIAAHITSGVFPAERGGLGANAASFGGLIKMYGGVASVAVAGTDYVAVSHTHIASQVSDFADAVAAAASVAANTAARHTQNTDTGTTASSFQLDSDAGGGRLLWSGSEMRLRNEANDAYVSLRVLDLYVEGTTTTINSNEVNIGDSVILLNSDITIAGANSSGGFDIKLLAADNSTRRDVGIRYDLSTRRWTGSGFTATTEAPVTLPIAQRFAVNIGDGVTDTFNIDHGLNTLDVVVSIIEIATGEAVMVDWKVSTVNRVQVIFHSDYTPTTAQYRVVVIG